MDLKHRVGDLEVAAKGAGAELKGGEASVRSWFAAARGRMVREVERLVSRHHPGSRLKDPVDVQPRNHSLRFEVCGEVLATLREALAKNRRNADGPIDDDATLLLMRQQVLAGRRLKVAPATSSH